MGFYRKKPAIIEAFRWTKISDQKKKPQWFIEAIEKGVIFTGGTYTGDGKFCEPILIIHTLEGNHEAHFGDWIIKGVMGEIYSCKPDIFEMTYDPVGPDTESLVEALEGAKWLIESYVSDLEHSEEYQDVVKAIRKARGNVNEPEATVECFLGCPKTNDLMKKYMRKHYRRTR